jgi:hypothetical protein
VKTNGYEKWHAIEIPVDLAKQLCAEAEAAEAYRVDGDSIDEYLEKVALNSAEQMTAEEQGERLSLEARKEFLESPELEKLDATYQRARDELAETMCEKKHGKKRAKFGSEQAKDEVAIPTLDPLDGYVGARLRVYNNYDLETYAKNIDSLCNNDDQKKTVSILKALDGLGDFRRLKKIHSNWRILLNSLEEKFPNFLAVIDYIREACALSDVAFVQNVLDLDNILLEGLPGTGKSYFCEALADFLDSGRICHRMEVSQASSSISGSDAFWSNAKNGSVFDAIALGLHLGSSGFSYANPTFILDEIDKIDTGGRYNPESALLSLLEKSTATQYTDLCYPWLKINASKIVWISTCNDSSNGNVSAPLLSRMRKFVIDQPSPSQALQIVQGIVDVILQDYVATGIEFSESAIAALCVMSPRKMKAEAKSAIGRVLYRQRGLVVSADDISGSEKARRRMGFLP